MNGSTGLVRVVRGGTTESVHRFHAVAVRRGRIIARVGDPDRRTFYRSASKPFQALPLVEDGVLERFGFGWRELALACGSHSAEPGHVEVARGMLDRMGLGEEDLECGGHWPLKEDAALRFLEEGRAPGRLDSNCSGKHAGMLALARFYGWDVRGYVGEDHPVQRRMLRETLRWTGLSAGEVATGVDGCGVVCFAVPLRVMALSFARFATAARAGEGAREVFGAMTSHPFLVAGTGRLCTDLMRAMPGIMAKVGAEGVYGVAIPEEELGVAVKVEDGGWRAVEPALVRFMECLGLLDSRAAPVVERFGTPALRNTRGDVVGQLEAEFVVEKG